MTPYERAAIAVFEVHGAMWKYANRRERRDARAKAAAAIRAFSEAREQEQSLKLASINYVLDLANRSYFSTALTAQLPTNPA